MKLSLFLLQALDEIASGVDTNNTVEDKDEGADSDMSRKFGSRKYGALRTSPNEQVSGKDLSQESVSSSLANDANDSHSTSSAPSSALASKWESMMHGYKSLRSNIDSSRFFPLGVQGTTISSHSSFESLDEIFERLKHPPSEHRENSD